MGFHVSSVKRVVNRDLSAVRKSNHLFLSIKLPQTKEECVAHADAWAALSSVQGIFYGMGGAQES